jgi:hypothetical protein
MSETVTITVTQDHINKGVKQDCWSCPIALAIQDAMPGVICAEVLNPDLGFATIFGDDGDCGEALLPDPARHFIAEFDNGQTVHPFAFEAVIER